MSSWFPPSKPLPVKDGLKARSKRGAIAQKWWSERFIEVLQTIVVGGRLQRGRTYARNGQVIEMELGAGTVTASVQGSRVRPYRVRIGLTPFDDADWGQVAGALVDNAWYTAKLLAGEMPDDIEDVFTAVGLSLFPAGSSDLSMDCTCPDPDGPCKHIAAVFYLLAESFDDDPFTILAWRGRNRDELLGTLSDLRSGGASVAGDDSTDGAASLADCLGSFFSYQAAVPHRTATSTPPDAVLHQAPAVDVSVRGTRLADLLRPAYHAIARTGETP
ncbi:SWIM zinc finger family protein [Phytoactinopolyspora halotolerans]|uniref:SWIM-type domain-containing protein n=1 Tax=Phytoactinopolyspora halotolerans TaxID=1981512 RepID=A0A6L9S010_9ACTN|nr:SWIM zinc finger family protein [Phytoactinopolyspora halotolerans]NED98575.1 hypothetical protein [Phytoactinopolyspora halotolerans]